MPSPLVGEGRKKGVLYMSILGIFGFPGCGKTTVLAATVERDLQHKPSWFGLPLHDKIFTTFPCVGAYRLDFDDLGKYAMPNSLIVIDEVSLYADNRQFKSFTAEKLEFFKLHRHQHSDVIWCSQSATDADRKIRTSTDYMYLVEPALFGYSIVKPIQKGFDLSNDIADKYYLSHPFNWIYVNRAKYYHLFDSYECKELPLYPCKLW